ncbi:uncharacterized protein BYT42DRAFT_571867 [Radiomyces spectabilis]|uniref:uncharacterized protein n=1 Tax=Radiomyces spectabilis TaxID=64574 RepID=UPI00221F5917|nr:uncharacterized protein BYT42DRAFT_571867 [Radiomyces spectabilis]KAI8377832.1 hypothetical protein BYT42DRAFT_571867 [Radiomyces spectabilis]
MSDRPRRKRKQRNTIASNVHYVGYVEDEESVEAIMKKFEELERIQREFSSMAVKSDEGSNKENEVKSESVDAGIPEEDAPMTEEQLQEVFKRTSAFTVKSAMIDTNTVDDMDAMELWQVEFRDSNTDELYEEDDYIHVDDDFWDLEFGESPRQHKRLRRGAIPTRDRPAGQRRGVDRESIIAKYKIMQIQVQDRNGNYFMVKKRVSALDPSLPTYVKIPGKPIPRSWAHTILHMQPKASLTIPLASQLHQVDDILSTDLKQFGQGFSAVYMDPPLLLPGEEPVPGKIHIDDLAKLNVSEIVDAGFLFIWLEKEWLQRIVNITATWGFKYVENFCWIKKNINNQFHKSPYTYFNKSKLSLLIFRKEGEIELRHQRNPDCVFDFVRPPLPDEVSEAKPAFMYDVIETLLPNAVYHAEKNPKGEKLLELWAKKGQRRTGWTTVVERS